MPSVVHLVLAELEEVGEEGRKVNPVSGGARPAPKPGWRRSSGGLLFRASRDKERVGTEHEADEELGE